MSGDLVTIFLLSLYAVVSPTLFGATTVMLLIPNPKRLMLGYLLGAYMTSITLGLLIVFSLHGTSTEKTSKHRIGPVEDIIVGLLALAIAFVLRMGLDRRFDERRRAKKEAKQEARRQAGKPTESLSLRLLGKGNPWVTFGVGAVLAFPGVTYLDALDHIHRLRPGTVATVLLVIYFCLMQLLLLEVPLLGYVFAPQRTESAVTAFRAWIGRRGRTIVVIGATLIGVWLVVRGVITLL